ncbi:hypothetical protein [Frigoribacterium salinisoli]
MDATTPPARSGPDGPGDGAVDGVRAGAADTTGPVDPDAAEDTALEDWDRFFADVPEDLVFECIIENHHLVGGISVFRDRVVLCDPSPDEPTVASLERITGWGLVDVDTEVVVSIEAQRPLRTRLPRSFHQAVSHALMTTLGDSRHLR